MGLNKIDKLIHSALKEDIGRGDITTRLIVPKEKKIKAVFLAREACMICGLELAGKVFKAVDKKIKFKPLCKDGQRIQKGKVIARINGSARGILAGERVALNFLSLLSGIATKTHEFVKRIKPYAVKISDTRKTIPGLRQLEKYAVRIGGGYNHRMRLDEMILVKDNHIQVIGHRSWVVGLKEIRKKILPQTKIEIEVKNLKEFREALKVGPDIIMLDNMRIKDIKRAVMIRNSLLPNTYHLIPKLEVSGGINLNNVKKFAASGVDLISVGNLTHSVKSIDLSLEVI